MRRNIRFMRLKSGKDRIVLNYLRKPVIIPGLSMRLAGYVKSRLFPQNIGLIIDSRERDDISYEYACAALGADGSARILMEPEVYLDFVRGKPYARTAILHELGHIFHNDLPEIHCAGTEYDAERQTAIDGGKVHERELRADAFAARFLGADVACEGLLFLRDADIAEDKEANAPSLWELGSRIQILNAATDPSI